MASDTRQQDLLRAARAYLERGWVLTPTRAATTKGAYLPGWASLRLGPSQLAAELDRPGKGLGVVLGEPSGGLVDVDLDHPAAVRAADALLPPTSLVSGRSARPRTHRFYRADGVASAAFPSAATGMLVELRARGCQTVLPPSPHPAGRYSWDALGEPREVRADLLRRLTGQVASAAFLVAQGWRLREAVSFARDPDPIQIASWERAHDDCPPLRAWLELAVGSGTHAAEGPPSRHACGAPSSATRALLARLGGVVGAGRLLGLALREGRQRCPWHAGRGARSLQVTGPLWRCHAGCGSGNPIHLAAKVLGLPYREARRALAERVDRGSREDLRWRGGEGGKRARSSQPTQGGAPRHEGGGARRAKRRRRA